MIRETRNLGLFAMMLLPLALASPSRAAVPTESLVKLYSGGTITWSGTAANKNQFKGAAGTATINNSALPIVIVGASWTTKGAGANPAIFCADVPGKAQAAGRAYYVYYAAYVNAGVTSYTHVVSTTPPFAEGHPDAAITFTNPAGGATTTQAAVFLGSYLTDLAADMVPFERMGERVVLVKGAAFASQTFALNAANGTLLTRTLSFQIPASASALLVDFHVSGPGGGPADLLVLDPRANGGGCGVGVSKIQADLYVAAGGDVQYENLRIKNVATVGDVTIQLCPVAAQPRTAVADLVGYIEPFPHLY